MSNAHKLYIQSKNVDITLHDFILSSIEDIKKYITNTESDNIERDNDSAKCSESLNGKYWVTSKVFFRQKNRLIADNTHIPIRCSNNSKRCISCRIRRPSFKCVGCNQFVCVTIIDDNNVSQSCWEKLHSN